jgi:[ribosomal protein S5]-alanine N-acetyltransferase
VKANVLCTQYLTLAFNNVRLYSYHVLNKTINTEVFKTFPTLTTERLLLNAFNEGKQTDIEVLFDLRSQPEVVRYMDRDPYQTQEEAETFLKNTGAWFTQGTAINWAIRQHGKTQVIGYITIFSMDTTNCRAMLGYALLPPYWKKGFMQEAGRAVIAFCRDTLWLHSIEATINPENEASRNTLLGLGFEKESYKRQDFQYNGLFLDSEGYGLVIGRQ